MVLCEDASFYTGCTKNLDARIAKHNAGKGANYTRARLPVKLVYVEHGFTHSTALKREYQIKQLSRLKKMELVRSYS